MKLLLILTLLLGTLEATFSIPSHEIRRIGEKIWRNECGETLLGLTCWKSGETFASLGIGHFIWYSTQEQDRFHETFPDLLVFFETHGIPLPLWLQESKSCPWTTKEEFENSLYSPKMIELRKLLSETFELQALFIAIRLERALPKMSEKLNDIERLHVENNFYQLAGTARGLYALMDYVNFKGEGIAPLECYNDKGWGLLQVLLRMPVEQGDALSAFVTAATFILEERVTHSPPERNEIQWLPGWIARIRSYLNFE